MNALISIKQNNGELEYAVVPLSSLPAVSVYMDAWELKAYYAGREEDLRACLERLLSAPENGTGYGNPTVDGVYASAELNGEALAINAEAMMRPRVESPLHSDCPADDNGRHKVAKGYKGCVKCGAQ